MAPHRNGLDLTTKLGCVLAFGDLSDCVAAAILARRWGRVDGDSDLRTLALGARGHQVSFMEPIRGVLCGALALGLVVPMGCLDRPLPVEIVSLQKLRTDPSVTGNQKEAFYALAAADDLLVRARSEWDSRDDKRARRDADMGQIKMKTAMAILQSERARARLASLDMELKAARDEEHEADQALTAFQEDVAMGARLASVSAKVADQRKAATQVESDRQKLIGEVADDKRHLEALDALRAAELDLKSADTVMASQYAKTPYDATVAMLQEAHRQFDAGNWDQALARAVTASGEAASAIDAARPRYEQAEQANAAALRDRALEEAAAGIGGIETRFERQKDLQKLVLVLRHLFLQHRSSFTPQGAKALDAVEKLLASFPMYPVRIAGFTERVEGRRQVPSTSLTRANDVYWALVARGLDPRRISLDVGGAAGPGTAEPDDRVEIAILYHARKS